VRAEAGPPSLPLLPADCDSVALPETQLDREPDASPIGLGDIQHIRADGETIYYLDMEGIYTVAVPGGTPVLVVPGPQVARPGSSTPSRSLFSDFWLDETTITAVLDESIYTAPRSGGDATLKPGSVAPSWENAGLIYYARAGDNIYVVSEFRESLRRAPYAGGPFVDFFALSKRGDVSVGPPLLAGDSLLCVGKEDTDADVDETVFSVPLAGGPANNVAHGMFFPYPIAYDGNIYVTEETVSVGQLWRITAGGERVKLSAPPNVVVWTPEPWMEPVTYGGASYVVANALYQLPDDRRTTWRSVLLRISPDSDTADIARCIPEAPLDPLVPLEDEHSAATAITASDAGVFVAQTRRNTHDFRRRARLLRVLP
jgi:hypothetical protein